MLDELEIVLDPEDAAAIGAPTPEGEDAAEESSSDEAEADEVG